MGAGGGADLPCDSGGVAAWGPLRGGGPAGRVYPRCRLCPFISVPGAPPWVTVTHPRQWTGRWQRQLLATVGWLASSRRPRKRAGRSPVGSWPATWAFWGSATALGAGSPSLSAGCASRPSGRGWALPKPAGSGSPCPGRGPVCTRAAKKVTPPPEMLAGAVTSRLRLLSWGCRRVWDVSPWTPSSASVLPRVPCPGRNEQLAQPLTRWGGRRNPRT